jgi:C4-dicarboxylate-specific signal transduction histidine kinase
MQRVTQRLRRISETLVDFSRVRNQRLELLGLRHLIDEAWSLVAIDEKASSVDFLNEVSAEDHIVGNSDRLGQVFVNVLRNALNAVEPAHGQIVVRGRRAERSGEAGIAVRVEDNGPGIPADLLPDIFSAFVTTRLDARGTGLGLTVAEGIVTQHGGAISASNRNEGGACLEVWLPAAR